MTQTVPPLVYIPVPATTLLGACQGNAGVCSLVLNTHRLHKGERALHLCAARVSHNKRTCGRRMHASDATAHAEALVGDSCSERSACVHWPLARMRRYVLERQYTTVEGEREQCPFAPPAADAEQRSAC